MDEQPAAELRSTLNLIPAHTWYARPSGALAFVNERCADYLGLPKDHPLRLGAEAGSEVAWDAHVALFHPDDDQEARRLWSACLGAGSGGEASFRVRSGRGDYRWFLGRCDPWRAADGTLLGWIGINFDIDEHRQAEFFLAEGQRLAHLGSWAFNADGLLRWSAELFKIHGLEPGGQPPTVAEYLARVHPEDREFLAREIEKMQGERRPFDITKRFIRPDGAIRHVRCVGSPVVEGGTFQGLIGTGMDVTEQEQLTEALRKSEEKFRLVVEGISALVATMTPRGDVEFVNRQVLRYFGKTFEELEGWQTNDAIHPDDRAMSVAAWTDAVEKAHPYEIDHRLRRFDGVYRWFRLRAQPSIDGHDRVARWFVVQTDIEERKLAEQKLEEQEKELRQMLDFAPQIVTVCGTQRQRLYANREALAYFGMSLDDWRRLPMGSDAHPDDQTRLLGPSFHAFSDGSPFEMEIRLRRYDGSYRWFLARGNPVRDQRGQITRWYLASTDIDDRKRSEERLQQENVALREEIDKSSMFEEIVGASPALARVLTRVSKVAGSDSTVLITGETGTGKELVARAIHRRSRRAVRPFVAVNCATIPRDLVASELFGHEKGAFSGAVQRRLGRFELADGGTLFLDEVGELSPEIQVALLRVLQERELDRVGGTQPIRVDVRVIAATNRDLAAAIDAGAFRQDLFYRLNVFPVAVPPLRERREDIPLLVRYFIDRYARKAGKSIRRVNKRALDRLQAYPWHGNIRELQNVIERSVIVCDTEEFTVDESWLSTKPAIDSRLKLSSSIAAHEKAIVEDALRATAGRVFGPSGAAARLGIPRSTLESKIRALRINKSHFRTRPG